MKLLFTSLILTLCFGGFVSTVSAQKNAEQFSIRVGKQKKAPRSKLTVKFVELIEDSRCAEGTNCVWAGNATIKVAVSKDGVSETFEMNTNTGAKGNVFAGYAINLTNLTPVPKANIRINRNAYTATFSINRMTR